MINESSKKRKVEDFETAPLPADHNKLELCRPMLTKSERAAVKAFRPTQNRSAVLLVVHQKYLQNFVNVFNELKLVDKEEIQIPRYISVAKPISEASFTQDILKYLVERSNRSIADNVITGHVIAPNDLGQYGSMCAATGHIDGDRFYKIFAKEAASLSPPVQVFPLFTFCYINNRKLTINPMVKSFCDDYDRVFM